MVFMHREDSTRAFNDVERALADDDFLEITAEDIAGDVPIDLLRTLLQLGKECVQIQDITARPAMGPRAILGHAASLEGTGVGRLIDALRRLPCSPLASRILDLLA